MSTIEEEEEELAQMVRDYIELSADSVSSTNTASSSKPSSLLTLQQVLGKQTDDEVELDERLCLYLKNNSTGGQCSTPRNQRKWLVMKLKMDGYDASLCKTSWDSKSSKVFQIQGKYEYVEVLKVDKRFSGGGEPTRLMVDMEFRSQFEVARPTRAYKELTDILPSIFVGTEDKLREILHLLCPAGTKSLKEKGLHVPPWRQASYMQSKWLSTNCQKITFSLNDELGVDQSGEEEEEEEETETEKEKEKEKEKSSSTCCSFIFN